MPAVMRPIAGHQAGLTLLEILIGLALGLLIMVGLVTLFVQHRASHRQNEAIAALQDSARFALHVLSRDLLMAGHWGGPPDASGLTIDPVSTALPSGIDCGSPGAVPYLLDVNRRLEFINNLVPSATIGTYPCFSGGDLMPGTDLFMVRYAQGRSHDTLVAGQTQATLEPHAFYIQANQSRGTLFRNGSSSLYMLNGAFSPQAAPLSFWEYTARIYHVRPYAEVPGDNIPTLCRRELKGEASIEFREECLAEGVQDLQILWGLDDNSDGLPDRYYAAPDAAQLRRAVTAKIDLLVRSPQRVSGYLDGKGFEIGDKRGPNRILAAQDAYFRKIYSTTVALRNPVFRP